MRITVTPTSFNKITHAFMKQQEIEAVLNGLIAIEQWEVLGKYTDREISPLDLNNWTLTLHATKAEVETAPAYLISRLLLDIRENNWDYRLYKENGEINNKRHD